jgi:hypothetical protein
MKLEIRYNHTSTATANSYAEALEQVRTEAIYTIKGKFAADEMVSVKVDDGTYIYATQEDADRDDTGARAFAVICSPD